MTKLTNNQKILEQRAKMVRLWKDFVVYESKEALDEDKKMAKKIFSKMRFAFENSKIPYIIKSIIVYNCYKKMDKLLFNKDYDLYKEYLEWLSNLGG